ncbi:5'-AMP-activated protein kinase subunit beta-1 [Porphyridium purpureum]|uniref:5'-AMP-activated protein kinase subunit beta-1 n=1 Tax=Porphyridium purpureum TaxID=35688 RepID=A0A5J4Z924_PORPP|nr:5'-AMP-activated protein kinase subunit beta-1 [Porphyridium purpureum]|eukprot:POR0196..scf295_1
MLVSEEPRARRSPFHASSVLMQLACRVAHEILICKGDVHRDWQGCVGRARAQLEQQSAPDAEILVVPLRAVVLTKAALVRDAVIAFAVMGDAAKIARSAQSGEKVVCVVNARRSGPQLPVLVRLRELEETNATDQDVCCVWTGMKGAKYPVEYSHPLSKEEWFSVSELAHARKFLVMEPKSVGLFRLVRVSAPKLIQNGSGIGLVSQNVLLSDSLTRFAMLASAEAAMRNAFVQHVCAMSSSGAGALACLVEMFADLLSRFPEQDDIFKRIVLKLARALAMGGSIESQHAGVSVLATLAVLTRRAKNARLRAVARDILKHDAICEPGAFVMAAHSQHHDVMLAFGRFLKEHGHNVHVLLLCEDVKEEERCFASSRPGLKDGQSFKQVALFPERVRCFSAQLVDGTSVHIVGRKAQSTDEIDASHLNGSESVAAFLSCVCESPPRMVISTGASLSNLGLSFKERRGKGPGRDQTAFVHLLDLAERVDSEQTKRFSFDGIISQNEEQRTALCTMIEKDWTLERLHVHIHGGSDQASAATRIQALYSVIGKTYFPAQAVIRAAYSLESTQEPEQRNSTHLLEAAKRASFSWPSRGAQTVWLVGSFDSWATPGTPLDADLQLQMYLPVGRHFYKYIVDGQWLNDEQAPVTADESGFLNNVIVI